MLLIITLILFSSLQSIIVIEAENITHTLDDDLPEKFYVTHEAWFNISVRESKLSTISIRTEQIVVGLFGEICPMTVTNFITITRGFRRGSVCIEKK